MVVERLEGHNIVIPGFFLLVLFSNTLRSQLQTECGVCCYLATLRGHSYTLSMVSHMLLLSRTSVTLSINISLNTQPIQCLQLLECQPQSGI